ncbi:MAG: hypothetical protein HYX92_07100 [Chloroflexi bacterium]|nr:hypothetical protein [Chloroflexota bacterium]
MKAKRTAFFLAGGIVAVALATMAGMNALEPVRAAHDAPLSVQIKATSSEFRVTYEITLVNDTTSDIGDVYVSGTIPESARFMEVVATPAGSTSLGKVDNVAAWVVSKVPAKGKVGPLSYKVAPSERFFGEAHAWVHWKSPMDGTAASDSIFQGDVVLDLPKRGCTSCHVLRDTTTGAVTIAYEAKVRGGPNHPVLAFDTTVEGCLQCHKPGAGDRKDMGAVAPKMLRDIVHPAHMNSPSFIGTYKGNCFTCHNVNGDGTFTLLGEKLKTDFRGIPEESPVKGIPPSQRR